MRIFYLILILFLITDCLQIKGQNKNHMYIRKSVNFKKHVNQKRNEFNINKAKAIQRAHTLNRPTEFQTYNNKTAKLVGVDKNDRLIYRITHNRDLIKSVGADKIHPGGEIGLNLTGKGLTLCIWDYEGVYKSHKEFEGRVTQKDNPAFSSPHATHVAGTMISSGQYNLSSKGVAYEANLNAYNWDNDISEMTQEAGVGLLISNHSYGIVAGFSQGSDGIWDWHGGKDNLEDPYFGKYSYLDKDLDELAFNFPYYLIVKSAGNDNGDGPQKGERYRDYGSGNFTYEYRETDGKNGYDCIPSGSVAKNILTVGATQSMPNGYSSASNTHITSFSSRGPTDDGRIKPDISSDGYYVYSTNTNNKYFYSSGSSMASPGLTGALLLLQQHHNNTYGKFMKSATLKALAIATANEAGKYPGPDYKFGWGIINASGAAKLISDNKLNSVIIEELLANDKTIELYLKPDKNSWLYTTIAWTDPHSTYEYPAKLNSRRKLLVNDLDIKIKNETTNQEFFPWILDVENPSAAATNGDNSVDNVEQIKIENTINGIYKLTLSHKNNLKNNSSQEVSIIIDGASNLIPEFELLTSESISSETVVKVKNTSHSITGQVDSYKWDISPDTFEYTNSTNSNSKSPNLKFKNSDNYTITLNISNKYGESSKSVTKKINILKLDKPNVEFIASTYKAKRGHLVELLSESESHEPPSYEWTITPKNYSYALGTNRNSVNPVLTFNSTGIYNVTLNCTNSSGESQLVKNNLINIIDNTPKIVNFSVTNNFNSAVLNWEVSSTLKLLENFEGSWPPQNWSLKISDSSDVLTPSSKNSSNIQKFTINQYLQKGIKVFSGNSSAETTSSQSKPQWLISPEIFITENDNLFFRTNSSNSEIFKILVYSDKWDVLKDFSQENLLMSEIQEIDLSEFKNMKIKFAFMILTNNQSSAYIDDVLIGNYYDIYPDRESMVRTKPDLNWQLPTNTSHNLNYEILNISGFEVYSFNKLALTTSNIHTRKCSNVQLSTNTYRYKIRAIYNDGTKYSDFSEEKSIDIINRKPIAIAYNQITERGRITLLDGSGSYDPDRNRLFYLWSTNEDIVLNNATSKIASFTPPLNSSQQSYSFSLVVSDRNLKSDVKNIIVTIKENNNKPIANAEEDQIVFENETVNISAKNSSDPDNDSLSYYWYNNHNITIDNPKLANISFKAPEIKSNTPQKFSIYLKVSDGLEDSSEDEVVITVININKAPTIELDDTCFISNKLTLIPKIKDEDNDSLNFHWTAESPGIIIEDSYAKNVVLKIVNPLKTPNYSKLNLTVSDGFGGVTTESSVLQYDPISSKPVLSVQKHFFEMENSSVDISVTCENFETESLKYNWEIPDTFKIIEFRNSSVTIKTPNIEENIQKADTIKVFASDGINVSDTHIIEFNTNNINTAPKISQTDKITVLENETFTISPEFRDEDNDKLYIYWESTNEITISDNTSTSPQFTVGNLKSSEPEEYKINVSANDGIITTRKQITVQVNKRNTPPVAVTTKFIELAEGSTSTLDASNSYDDDGDKLNYLWYGSSSNMLNFTNISQPKITTPLVLKDSTIILYLKVHDGTEYSVFNETRILIKNIITSIENNYLNNIVVKPNPIIDNIIIDKSKYPGKINISLSNSSGKIIFNKMNLTGNTITINAYRLTSGTYILNITDSNGNKFSTKLIK